MMLRLFLSMTILTSDAILKIVWLSALITELAFRIINNEGSKVQSISYGISYGCAQNILIPFAKGELMPTSTLGSAQWHPCTFHC